MEFRPHEYQIYAIRFIMEHPACAVILGMGLGKTVITLTAIEELKYNRFETGKALIVAPLRVAKVTWPDEIGKWDHLKHLTFSLVTGTKKQRMAALAADADIYIVNRENLSWLIEDSGYDFDYDTVVIDELSSMKSWQSGRFRSFMKVRPKVKRVIGLTGTPGSNGLMDLFAEFKCLDMGERLGRFIGQYRLNYFRPDRMNGQIVYSYAPLPGAEEKIYEKISDITISMKALDHLKMPELISTKYPVYLSDAEKEKYDAMKKDLILPFTDTEGITAVNAAALSGKLCQMANGAVYADGGEAVLIHDRKLDALEDILEAAGSEPVLVAYWFKHDLTRIEKRLDGLGIRHDRIRTDESIRQWNEGKLPVGLIHPASAGHGLNLQAGGSSLVWFGICWSLELYDQTVARIWRQGQSSKTVVVQHITADGTIDERILAALTRKEKTQNALIDAVRAEVYTEGSNGSGRV